MPLLKWTEEFSVHNLQIDEQHKILIGFINDLHSAMRTGKAKEFCGRILNELIDYTQNHFSNEENLMLIYDYPESSEHKKAHEKLIEKVKFYELRYQDGENWLNLDFFNFLNQWLIQHILVTDKKLGFFLKEKGLH